MIARAEAGTPSGALTEVDLSAVVADVAELYGPLAEERGMVLVTDIVPRA
jgi:signal transduction histidine kinase